MATKTEKVNFNDWMKEVDTCVSKSLGFGLGVYDLPDCPFYDWFDDGMTPKQAARKAIHIAKTEF